MSSMPTGCLKLDVGLVAAALTWAVMNYGAPSFDNCFSKLRRRMIPRIDWRRVRITIPDLIASNVGASLMIQARLLRWISNSQACLDPLLEVCRSLEQDMNHERCNRLALTFPMALLCFCVVHSAAMATEAYRPIIATMASKMITLTGDDLTVEQVIDIARHGAKVTISEAAMKRGADSFGLMLEAQHEVI